MKISAKKRVLGFTLVELMIVVAIIGILASVSIPVFTKYIKKSKTAESSLNLRKIYDGEVAYIQEEHTDSSGGVILKQFVSAPPTPGTIPGINKTVGDWSPQAWSDLKFSPDGPVQYQYEATAEGTENASAFTAYAVGDLDGDGSTSIFLRTGILDDAGNVEGGAGIYSIDETE